MWTNVVNKNSIENSCRKYSNDRLCWRISTSSYSLLSWLVRVYWRTPYLINIHRFGMFQWNQIRTNSTFRKCLNFCHPQDPWPFSTSLSRLQGRETPIYNPFYQVPTKFNESNAFHRNLIHTPIVLYTDTNRRVYNIAFPAFDCHETSTIFWSLSLFPTTTTF